MLWRLHGTTQCSDADGHVFSHLTNLSRSGPPLVIPPAMYLRKQRLSSPLCCHTAGPHQGSCLPSQPPQQPRRPPPPDTTTLCPAPLPEPVQPAAATGAAASRPAVPKLVQPPANPPAKLSARRQAEFPNKWGRWRFRGPHHPHSVSQSCGCAITTESRGCRDRVKSSSTTTSKQRGQQQHSRWAGTRAETCARSVCVVAGLPGMEHAADL
jgi:hypothetical protein